VGGKQLKFHPPFLFLAGWLDVWIAAHNFERGSPKDYFSKA
jgi:hypothetical protein